MASQPYFSDDQSIRREPHLYRPVPGEDVRDEPVFQGAPDASLEDAAEHGVWDEPVQRVSGKAAPEGAATYAVWYERMALATGINESWSKAFLLALAGGPLALAGALYAGGGGGVVGAVVIAPLVEETLKSAAAAIAVEKKPHWFCDPLQILFCVIVSALAFATVENLLYINVYVPNPSPGFIQWRWQVCTALHAGASSIAACGLIKVWKRSRQDWSRPNLSVGAPWLVAAMCVHGVYNLFAVLLDAFKFEF